MSGPGAARTLSRRLLPVLGALFLGAQAHPAGASIVLLPDVIRVTPSSVQQGRTAQLTLEVKNVAFPACTLDFGAGTTVAAIPAPLMITQTTARLTLQVAAGAPVGLHEIGATCAGQARRRASVALTVTAAAAPPPPPDILSTAPSLLKRGQSYDLVPQFSAAGQDVWTVRALDFGAGITATYQPGRDVRTWTLVVSPQAPLGRHDITISYTKAGDDLFSKRVATAYVTVTGTGDGPPAGAVVPPPPDVVAVAPATLPQGQEATLRLTVKNFTDAPKLSFGDGITVLGRPAYRNDDREHPTLRVAVAADAPLGRHDIAIENGPKRRTATAFVTVTPGAAPPVVIERKTIPPVGELRPAPARLAVFDVLAVSPNVWRVGSSYELTLTGRGFAQGLQVRFADGVTVAGEPQVVSPSQARVTIAVAADAPLGVRRVEAATGRNRDFDGTSATARVTLALDAARPAKDQIVPLYETALYDPAPDTITLIEPAPFDESFMAGPTFNDQTTFRWQEENPGLSNEFELRIVYVAGDGTQSPLVTARIKPQPGAELPPTYYSPDAATWDKLLTGTFDLVESSTVEYVGPDGQAQPGPKTYTYSGKLGTRTMHWQVTGYRVFTKVTYGPELGAQQQQGKSAKQVSKHELLVAQSELRPLRHPSQPLGLWCFGGQNSLTPEGSRDSNDLKFQNLEAGSSVNYTNDRIEVSGTIQLTDLPYQMQGDAGPEPDGGESATYYNVFIDWGDGTGASPVSASFPPPPSHTSYHPPATTADLDGLVHRYTKAGTHVIRVFMLSAADAWNSDPSALAPAVDGAKPDSKNPWYDDPEQFAGSSPLDVARRAYLMYCGSITVVPRKDLVSEGPLLLESIEITGFNGEGGGEPSVVGARKDPIDVTTAKAKLAAPAGATPSAADAVAAKGLQEPLSAQAALQHPGPGATPAAKQGDGSGEVKAVQKYDGPLEATKVVEISPAAALPAVGLPPVFSECSSIQGNAKLKYFGCGTARIEWRLEDAGGGSSVVLGTVEVPVGPSPAREDLGPPISDEMRDVLNALAALGVGTGAPKESSPKLGVKYLASQVAKLSKEQAGRRFALRVSASVVSHCADEAAAAAALKFGPQGSRKSAGAGIRRDDLTRTKPAAPGDLGVLSPYREGRSGRTGVAFVRGSAPADFAGALAKSAREKPFHVEAEPSPFFVSTSDPKLPCRFLFTTADGGFEVDTLRNLQDAGGGRWSGQGAFHFLFPEDPGKQERIVQATFASWLAPDGFKVVEGALELQSPVPGQLDARGMRVKIGSLSGAAGAAGKVDLQLTARLPQNRLPGADLAWAATAPLSSAGDWAAAVGPVPRAPLGYSGHDVESAAAVIDLREVANLKEPASACGSGPAWMGFHFGDAKIYPNTFGLFAGLIYEAPGWTAAPKGLCGETSMVFGGGPAPFKQGVLGWESIEAVAGGGNFTSTYKKFTATVPQPIDATFTGTVVLHEQSGKDPFPDFSAVTGPAAIERTYATPAGGTVTLAATHFGLGKFSDAGWGIRTDLALGFLADGKVFAAGVPVDAVVEGFDGLLYRQGGGGSPVQVPLGIGTTFGENVTAVIESVKVSGFGTGGLDFGFAVKVRISDKLAEAPMPVGFGLKQQGTTWAGRGPIAQPFVQEIVYNGGGSGGVNSKVELNFMKGDAAGDGAAHETSVGQCASTDYFCGYTDDLQMMGASVKADFRLGYTQGSSYFALRAEVSGLNITLPPCFALYGVRGGLGYNFKITDFLQKSLLDVVPDMGGDFVFMAGIAAGLASDPSLLSFDATLLISTGEQPMMTFKAWVLAPTKSAQGDVWGFFTVGAGGFDGAIAGDKSFFGDILRVQMPGDLGCYSQPSVKQVVQCAQSSWASVAHFGGLTDWYVYIGRKEGPRVTATLISLFKPNAYVTLRGIGGLAFGADFELKEEAKAGKFRAGFSVGASFGGSIMWPSPVGVAANAKGWAKVWGCYKSTCVTPGREVWMNMEFSTARTALAAGFSVGLICPVDSVSFGVQVLPSLGLSYDVDWCDYGIF
jgi:hypothetical protein